MADSRDKWKEKCKESKLQLKRRTLAVKRLREGRDENTQELITDFVQTHLAVENGFQVRLALMAIKMRSTSFGFGQILETQYRQYNLGEEDAKRKRINILGEDS